MERVYSLIKITLLGLILGALIILLLRLDYWAYDVKMTVRKLVVDQNNEYVKDYMEKNKRRPPACKVPNAPKHKI